MFYVIRNLQTFAKETEKFKTNLTLVMKKSLTEKSNALSKHSFKDNLPQHKISEIKQTKSLF